METFLLPASDGEKVSCYRWLIESPRAVVHIAHGMGEHARRYDRLAEALNAAGFSVYANDHRGHGETGAGQLGHMGGDGWNRVVADAYELNRRISGTHPDLPRVLLGHSMGSMISQLYITRHGASIDALVLSGTPGFRRGFASVLGRVVAAVERRRLGPEASSEVMQKLLFGDANKPFDAPDANGFEWLSRDAAEVQKYVDDDACGFVLTTGSLVDMFAASDVVQRPDVLAKIPKALPVYVMSGTADPVHRERKGVQTMLQAFYDQGLGDITVKWYDEGRHEMFNETNRDEVTADLVEWLNAKVN